jgi:hypothetical protein
MALFASVSSCRRAFQRAARHGEDQIAAELRARGDVLQRIDGGHGRFGRRTKSLVARNGAAMRALGLGVAARIGLGAADGKPRLDDFPTFDAISSEPRPWQNRRRGG